ncbi:MAG: protein translocase subunit SecF [Xanthomonadales bacterium]|nr:protein translocase subunit SecF [Xanthomonadales bacterium]
MFELFNPNWRVPFMKLSRVTLVLSAIALVISIALLVRPGLNFALDFTGGSVVELHFDQPADPGAIRAVLQQAGYEGAQVQSFGTARDVLIRIRPEQEQDQAGDADPTVATGGLRQSAGELIQTALANAGMESELRRNEYVGPQIGQELAEDGVVAAIFVIAGMMIYVAVRFEWRFGLASVAGEIHDVLLTLGFLALIGSEFDLPAMAAVLAVAGYSINDKIVIFDRIREMFRTTRKLTPEETIDVACSTTLSRTVITGVTTLLAVGALYLFGGVALKSFSVTLIFGIIVGMYSSVFFAAPVLGRIGVTKQDLMPKMRDETELARRP